MAVVDGKARAVAALDAWLAEAEVDHSRGVRPGEVVLRLPGEHRLQTVASVLVGEHSLGVSAFVVRRPEENREAFLSWLLRRNARLPGVAFALDRAGDVFLVGRLPVDAVTPQHLDALFGAVLGAVDGSFDELLRLGFASAVRREARWRVSRGLSLTNLAAFADLTAEAAGEGGSRADSGPGASGASPGGGPDPAPGTDRLRS